MTKQTKPIFRPQEYEDLCSAITIAIRNAPEDSPNFKRALERLKTKIWKKPIREKLTGES